MSKKKDKDMLKNLEQWVYDVMSDVKAEPKDKRDAALAGIKILQIKHKIGDGGDGEPNFFRKRGKRSSSS